MVLSSHEKGDIEENVAEFQFQILVVTLCLKRQRHVGGSVGHPEECHALNVGADPTPPTSLRLQIITRHVLYNSFCQRSIERRLSE
jgi:hypothetical protein